MQNGRAETAWSKQCRLSAASADSLNAVDNRKQSHRPFILHNPLRRNDLRRFRGGGGKIAVTPLVPTT